MRVRTCGSWGGSRVRRGRRRRKGRELRRRQWLSNLLRRRAQEDGGRCRRCGGWTLNQARLRFRLPLRRKQCVSPVGGIECARCKSLRYKRSQRLRPIKRKFHPAGARGGDQGGEAETHDFGRDAHAGELFLVLGAGFGTVIRDEDDLLACERRRSLKDADVEEGGWQTRVRLGRRRRNSLPLLRRSSKVSTVPSNR